MIESMLLKLILIILLGIGAQWLAWRYRMPAIVLMSIAGLLAGPLLGLIHPEQDLGELYHPFISIAVAIILFEGSLNLSVSEIRGRGMGRPLFQIVSIGSLLRWLFGALAAHFIAGLSWQVSFVLGALFIVTGPTVILPLLRQSKLKQRPAKVLKWEGIIIDPIGALLAVFAFQLVSFFSVPEVDFISLLFFFAAALFAAVLGHLFGKGMVWVLRHGHVPEFFKSPALFTVVLTCFGIADAIMAETGLLAVTAMGITMANTKVPAIQNMRLFHENISVLLLSTIFIILTASITRDTLLQVLDWRILGFVVFMLFIARPLAIFLSTFKTELTTKEKWLIGWIAPRGIVAITVANYFATHLQELNFAGAEMVSPVTFALVFISVTLHGFSLGWLASKLGLAIEERPGVIIVGSNPFTAAFGKTLQDFNIPVLIFDTSRERLKHAEDRDVPHKQGDFLDDDKGGIDTTPYDHVIAATEVESYNALVATRNIEEFGREYVYKLNTLEGESGEEESPVRTVSGHLLFDKSVPLETLIERVNNGYEFSRKEISEDYDEEAFKEDMRDKMVPLFISRANGNVSFFHEEDKVAVKNGDTVVAFHPPIDSDQQRTNEPLSQNIPQKD